MKRTAYLGLAAILSLLIGCAQSSSPSGPPLAKRLPTTVPLAGVTVTDDYWWLRKKDDPAVTEYLKAENAYTAARMKPTEALQEVLYEEFLSRIHETDESVPHRLNGFYYSTRTEQGKQYEIH